MKVTAALTSTMFILCLNCASNSGRIRAAKQKAEAVMQKLGGAWEQACRSGSVQTIQAARVESVAVFQGRVSTAGGTNVHTISGRHLKDLQKNITALRPESPAAVTIVADREEFNGSFRVNCAMRVSALTLGGGTITITPSGGLALVMSAFNGDVKNMERLIADGADINEQAKVSPLMAAADNGQAAALALLLKKGARVNDRAVFNGMTALHFAGRKGFLEILEILIQSGANLEITDNDGFTPLWSTAFVNKEEAIEFLLKKGANINHLDKNGNNIIAPAAANGSNHVIRLLVGRGVNPGNKNKFQRTALFDAIEHNKRDTVRLLISYKVDVNGRTTSGKSPLDAARQAGFSDIVRILEEAGAK